MTLGEGHVGFPGPHLSIQLQAFSAMRVSVVELNVQALDRPCWGVLLWGPRGSAFPPLSTP